MVDQPVAVHADQQRSTGDSGSGSRGLAARTSSRLSNAASRGPGAGGRPAAAGVPTRSSRQRRQGSRTRAPAAHQAPDRRCGRHAIPANTGRSRFCTRCNGWPRSSIGDPGRSRSQTAFLRPPSTGIVRGRGGRCHWSERLNQRHFGCGSNEGHRKGERELALRPASPDSPQEQASGPADQASLHVADAESFLSGQGAGFTPPIHGWSQRARKERRRPGESWAAVASRDAAALRRAEGVR